MIAAAFLYLIVSVTAAPLLPPGNHTPHASLMDSTTAAPRQYTLVPDKHGRLTIDKGRYRPGDILNLKGNFKSIYIANLNGTADKPIIIKNYRNTVVKIGEPAWNGGAYSAACEFVNCHYIRFGSQSDRDMIIINGSVKPAREAYRGLQIGGKSDNIEVCFLTITDGGNGIVAKTEPVKGDRSTVHPNLVMYNLMIHDITITGTKNEAMYIGHTATYWNHTLHQPYYGSPSKFTPGHDYVQPARWKNVKIYNCFVSNTGLDGIQTAAIDGLEIFNNEVTNWGTQRNPAHNGGILIGGRTTNTYVHDNYVHDGWGECCQFYGSGENNASHVISNNLFTDNQSDGISMRGTDNAIVHITNNTVACTKGNSIRINGYTGMKGKQIVAANALIAPNGGVNISPRFYIYVEQGGDASEGIGNEENKKFKTASEAGVNTAEYYRPQQGSSLGNAGYRKK